MLKDLPGQLIVDRTELARVPRSSDDRDHQVGIGGSLEALPEAGAERAIVASAADQADRHCAATTASAAIYSSGGSLKSWLSLR